MLGSKTPDSGRKPASIKDSHKGGGLRSGPPPLWEAAEGRLLYSGVYSGGLNSGGIFVLNASPDV
jgi:hypothetical protein